MSLLRELMARPSTLPSSSRWNVLGGCIYLALGFSTLVWPGSVQVVLSERPFVGDESALVRVIGMALCVIGWLTLFGARTGASAMVAASIVDRVILVPAVLIPLAMSGVFPHLLMSIAVLDPLLAMVSYVLWKKK